MAKGKDGEAATEQHQGIFAPPAHGNLTGQNSAKQRAKRHQGKQQGKVGLGKRQLGRHKRPEYGEYVEVITIKQVDQQNGQVSHYTPGSA